MKKDNCIFCKIANGEIPSRSIYEDDFFKAILDLSPATRGHALIIPKEHCQDLYDLPDETASKLMVTAKALALQMTERLKCGGFNLVQNNGELAGQTVPHFHLHLIPRYENDGQTLGWKPMELPAEELDMIKATITE